jgi:hypothetical protein
MKTEIEIIKGKIRKLLALSKSDNENEAAAALEKANELIGKYELDETDLRFQSVNVKSGKTHIPWKNAVSWLYGCHTYLKSSLGETIFTGEELDAFLAGEMYSYLIKTIERCAKKSIRKNARRKFRSSFKYGMASRLYDRIEELGGACSWSPRRNIKIEEAGELVKKSHVIETATLKTDNFNRSALTKGAAHGGRVSLSRQTGFIPTPQLTGTVKTAVQGELF